MKRVLLLLFVLAAALLPSLALAAPAGGVAYYMFDETSGTTAADSWGTFPGTLNGGCTWAAGHTNNGLQFNGTNAYVTLAGNPTTSLNDFTIACWVYLNTNQGWNRIFDFGTGTATYMCLTPSAGGSVIRYVIKYNGSAEQQINGTAALPTGSWQFVAVTLSGTTGKLYVNGAQVGTNTNITFKPSTLGTLTQKYIGKSQYNDPYLNGIVDDFQIYCRALSAYEITGLYNGTTYTTHTITASAGSGGTITPSGAVVVADGDSPTFTITPNFAYVVADVLVDGVSQGAITSYTFIGNAADHTIAASFTAAPTVSVSGTVTIGDIPTGAATVSLYSDAACTQLALTAATASDGSYIFSAVPRNTTCYLRATQSGYAPSAVLTVVVGTDAVTAADLALSTRRYEAEDPANTRVNIGTNIADANASGGYRVGKQNVSQYAGVTFNNVTVAQTGLYTLTLRYYGFGDGRRTEISVNGVAVTGSPFLCNAGGYATLAPVSVLLKAGTNSIVIGRAGGDWGPHWDCIDISVGFTPAPYHTIHASAGSGGTISPSGDVPVIDGDSQTFTIAPDTGYGILQVIVDSVNQGAISSYTFSANAADHTIVAGFYALPIYTITASAGTGGTCTPAGVTTVFQGESQTYTITPAFAYSISDVLVDGVSQGAVTTYTFSSIAANHTIAASFAALPTVNVSGTVTVGGVATDVATVSLYSDAACTQLATTASVDSSGAYTISTPQNSTVYLNATKSGFAPSAALTVTVADVDVTGVDLDITARRYEAENPANTRVNIGNNIAYANASGGYAIGKQWDGAYGGFTVNNVYAPSGGTYAVTVGIAAYGWLNNPVRSTYVDANGIAVGGPYWPTTDPGTFSVGVPLNAGANSITIWNPVNSWGPHWDYIDIASPVYLVTASTGYGITIDPSGVVPVIPGGNQMFTVTSGTVAKLLVDGVDKTADMVGNTYTLTNVKSDHTISFVGSQAAMLISRGAGGWRTDTWTIGTRFTTGSAPVYVTNLGYVDQNGDGLAVSHEVGIWDSDGNSLGSATVPAGTDGELVGDFRYVALSLPIGLAPNSTYTVNAFTEGDAWPDSAPNPGFGSPVFDGYVSLNSVARDGGAGFGPPVFAWGAAGNVGASCNLIGSTVLPPGYITISGKVRDANNGEAGVGAATISVLVNGAPVLAVITSYDSSGNYTAKAYVNVGDTFTVHAEKLNYLPWADSTPITYDGSVSSFFDVYTELWSISTYKISGTVTDFISGNAVVGLKLTITDPDIPEIVGTATTGAGGAYSASVDLTRNRYVVGLDPSNSPQPALLTAEADRTVLGPLEDDVTGVDLLVSYPSTISGTVVTSDASPKSGFAIVANDEFGTAKSTTTASDGTFSISVLPGYSYSVAARKSGYVTMPGPQTVDVALGNHAYTGIDFTATPTTIVGILKDASTGLPIYNGVVQSGDPTGPAAVTPADGSYSLPAMGCGGAELYGDAVNYMGRLLLVTPGTGALRKDIALTVAVEPNSYDGDMEDLAPAFKPTQWTYTPWDNAVYCIDWSASATAKTGLQSLFYCMNDTNRTEYAGIYKIIPLAPDYSYNFYFSAKADPEVARWQPMIEFQDAEGNNWDGFVSNDPLYYEYAHTPPYDWHTYFNWFDRGGTRTGAPVRWTPTPEQTEVHFIFLYEGSIANGTPDNLPPSGKGCYIDDLVLDAVAGDLPVETVAPDANATDVGSLAELKAKAGTGETVRLTGTVTVVAKGNGRFFVGEERYKGCIKVEANGHAIPAARTYATNLKGIVTVDAFGQYTLTLSADPAGAVSGNVITVIGANNKVAKTEAKLLTKLVRVWGNVLGATISDGYIDPITVKDPAMGTGLVVINGVLWKDTDGSVVLYQDLP